MSDLISREAVCENCMIETGGKGCWACLVKDAPTVDAEPVVHGHWIKTKNKCSADFTCSACGYTFTDADPEYECDYLGCPMCRAKMDEVST